MPEDSQRGGSGSPAAAAISASARKFPCPQCGADVVWSPGARKLRCDYCAFEQTVAAVGGSAGIGARAASGAGQPAAVVVERALADGLARKADLGWGAERKAVRCTKCGAVETFEPGVAAKACAFCGTPAVVEAPANVDLVRPEGVLPFTVAKNDALQRFRGWLNSLWFRPGNLKERAALTGIQGIYVPFWTFDADSHSDWTAEAGYRHGSGKNARVEWRPASWPCLAAASAASVRGPSQWHRARLPCRPPRRSRRQPDWSKGPPSRSTTSRDTPTSGSVKRVRKGRGPRSRRPA